MKVFTLLLALSVIGLQWPLWMGKASVSATSKMERELTEQKTRNAGLLARNTALDNEVKDLKNGLQAVEEYARSELGMVKSGEIFFQMVAQTPPPAIPKEPAKTPAMPKK
jgi:cell division protein FtsB